jgi:hypothetical protein
MLDAVRAPTGHENIAQALPGVYPGWVVLLQRALKERQNRTALRKAKNPPEACCSPGSPLAELYWVYAQG